MRTRLLAPGKIDSGSGKLASGGWVRFEGLERRWEERGRANDPSGARLNLFTGISVEGTLCPARQIRTMRVSFRANPSQTTHPPRTLQPTETLCIKMKRYSWKFHEKFRSTLRQRSRSQKLLNIAWIFLKLLFREFCGFRIAFEIVS